MSLHGAFTYLRLYTYKALKALQHWLLGLCISPQKTTWYGLRYVTYQTIQGRFVWKWNDSMQFDAVRLWDCDSIWYGFVREGVMQWLLLSFVVKFSFHLVLILHKKSISFRWDAEKIFKVPHLELISACLSANKPMLQCVPLTLCVCCVYSWNGSNVSDQISCTCVGIVFCFFNIPWLVGEWTLSWFWVLWCPDSWYNKSRTVIVLLCRHFAVKGSHLSSYNSTKKSRKLLRFVFLLCSCVRCEQLLGVNGKLRQELMLIMEPIPELQERLRQLLLLLVQR